MTRLVAFSSTAGPLRQARAVVGFGLQASALETDWFLRGSEE